MLIEKYTDEIKNKFNLSEDEAKKHALFLLGFIETIVKSEVDSYAKEQQ